MTGDDAPSSGRAQPLPHRGAPGRGAALQRALSAVAQGHEALPISGRHARRAAVGPPDSEDCARPAARRRRRVQPGAGRAQARQGLAGRLPAHRLSCQPSPHPRSGVCVGGGVVFGEGEAEWKDQQTEPFCCNSTLQPHHQARAILTFVEAISEKTLRSTVTLTAARGRGKSAALGLAMAAAIAYGLVWGCSDCQAASGVSLTPPNLPHLALPTGTQTHL